MTLHKSSRIFPALLLLFLGVFAGNASAQTDSEYKVSPGDVVRITVFQNADLAVESRVAGNGTINYPLVGSVVMGGLTAAAAESKLLQLLKLNGMDIDPRQLSVRVTKAPPVSAIATDESIDYRLGAGDAIRISVFQNPDLSIESRLSDSGTVTYPLLGTVQLGGLSVVTAERKLARLLSEGGFVVEPQLSISLIQVRGSQVSLLGLVNKPGRYPLEQSRMKLTDILALGGGIVPGAADHIVLVGKRDGKLMRKTIDVASMILTGGAEDDIPIQNGDIVYVNKAPVFYIFGEVQRPGPYRIERNMTLMQAVATGGGITQRGTLRRIQVFRRDENGGKGVGVELDMQDPIRPDDVINVRESLF